LTTKQELVNRQNTAQIKFLRSTAGYNLLEHRRNEDILDEIRVDFIEKKLA
jgi:hypothetical protein